MAIKQIKMSEEDQLLYDQMSAVKLEPGQMLFVGPLSVAYITGDFAKAPWLMPHVPPPGGKRLPDKFILNREEWDPKFKKKGNKS